VKTVNVFENNLIANLLYKRYRAEIVAIQVNETMPQELLFDVYFLDYGDSQFIGKKDILELRADFLSLRFQAIECFLAHIQPLNGASSNMDEWDEKSVEKFESMVQAAHWKKLISKVVAYKERKSFAFQRQSNKRESSPIPGVELYDPDDSTDKNIALELVKQGLAEMSNKEFGDLTKSAILKIVDDEVKVKVEEKKPEVVEPEKVAEETKVPSATNEKNNNSVSNGSEEKPRQSEPESLFSSSDNLPKKKKGKDQLTDFLKSEQQATTKKQKKPKEVDWNAMMEE
jgi:Tudor domain